MKCEVYLDSTENKEAKFHNPIFGTKFTNSKQYKLIGSKGLDLYVYELSKDAC